MRAEAALVIVIARSPSPQRLAKESWMVKKYLWRFVASLWDTHKDNMGHGYEMKFLI